jgi:hypothetical protein
MADFKSNSDVQEKSSDCFLGAGIILHDSGAISLEAGQRVRPRSVGQRRSRGVFIKEIK